MEQRNCMITFVAAGILPSFTATSSTLITFLLQPPLVSSGNFKPPSFSNCAKFNIIVFVAVVHSEQDGRAVGLFAKTVSNSVWVLSDTDTMVYYPDFGGSVTASSHIIIGVHNETDSSVSACYIPTPPQVTPAPIAVPLGFV